MQNINFFNSLLDSLYWDGYAEQLASTDARAYNFEVNELSNQYNLKP